MCVSELSFFFSRYVTSKFAKPADPAGFHLEDNNHRRGVYYSTEAVNNLKVRSSSVRPQAIADATVTARRGPG